MKHSITELYKIVGDNNHIYSQEAVQYINHAKSCCHAKQGDCYPMSSKIAQSKPFRIYDEIGSKVYRLAWLYGERIWFDSEKEIQDYRTKIEAERPERLRKTIIQKEAELATLRAKLKELTEKMEV